MADQPLVSVIVPIYNSENHIKRCIESLINQTYKNIELVLVNDGSKDNSKELIEEYEKKDERIKLYNQKNQGPSVARNTGLSKATGKYITFVDADDYVDKQMIEAMVDGIKNTNTLVFCDNSEVWIDRIDERNLFQEYKKEINKNDVIKEIASGKAGLVCGKLFSKDIVDRYNIRFDENINMCEDQIFFLNISKYCDSFKHMQKTLYHYDRRNENSITVKYQNRAIYNQMYVLDKLEEILTESSLDSKEAKSLMDRRYINSIDYCINNEIVNTSTISLKDRLSNIKNILNNEKFIKRLEYITPNSKREKIIIKAINNKGYKNLYFKFYTLDKIVYPAKRSVRKLLNR